MKAYEYIPRYTYSDYAQWEGKWELIHGYPHAMSPSPLKKHQRVSKKFVVQLDELIEANTSCKDCEVFYELDWIVNNDTVVRPDVMVVCGAFNDDFVKSPPTLIVEVLSQSTSLKDRHVKYQLYEAQGVKYYVIVNPETKALQIFELTNAEYVQNNTLTRFVLPDKCELTFDIPALVNGLKLE